MPQSQAVQEGKTLVLSCRTRGLPDIRYRWVKDDIEIPGANRSDLVLSSVRMEDFGRYFCRVWRVDLLLQISLKSMYSLLLE